MRIGIDVRVLMDSRYSGVAEYTRQLLMALFRLDRKNEYILYYNSYRDLSARMPEFTAPNVRYLHTSYPNKLFNYFLTGLARRPKLDKLTGAEVFLMPHINFAAFSGSARILLTIHDLSFLRFPELYSGRKRFWHACLGLKRLARKMDRIVAISESTKNDIKTLLDVTEERITVVYSAAAPGFRPLDRQDSTREAVRKKYGLAGEFILSLGTLEPRKNIEGAIKAYYAMIRRRPELSSLGLVIAGAPGWKYRSIHQARDASPNRGRIKFLDYVDDADRNALYNLARLFVYPSFYEGFGLPPLEAMSAGCPVIAGNLSSLPEVVGDGGLLVNPYDLNELAAAMEAVLTDENLRGDLISHGLARSKMFNWDKTAGEYLQIFTRQTS